MTAVAPTGAQPPGYSAVSASRIAGAAGLTFGVLSLIGIASITDPADLPIERVRPIRDDIDRRVQALLDELGLRPGKT